MVTQAQRSQNFPANFLDALELLMSEYSFINNIFRSDTAKKGGVVRRSKANVHRNASLDAFAKETKKREFHLLETTDHYIIICNNQCCTLHF